MPEPPDPAETWAKYLCCSGNLRNRISAFIWGETPAEAEPDVNLVKPHPPPPRKACVRVFGVLEARCPGLGSRLAELEIGGEPKQSRDTQRFH